MKIKLNGSSFEVQEYDDNITIVERYALKQDDGSLPSFYRIENQDFILKPGLEVTIVDIRQEVTGWKADDFEDVAKVTNLLSYYPLVEKADLGLMWLGTLTDKAITKVDFTSLRGLSRSIFKSEADARSAMVEYANMVKKKRKELEERMKERNTLFKKLDKVTPVETQPFVIEQNETSLVLRLPNGENLIDVFDAFECSLEIPFIHLVYRSKHYYKIYSLLDTPSIWLIDDVDLKEGIYFKILDTPVSSRHVMLENMYGTCSWLPDNRLFLEFKAKPEVTEEVMKDKIIDSLGDRVIIEIVSIRQIAIKGRFVMDSIEINREVFADLVFTSDVFSHFLFLNEKAKTLTAKPRFDVYYGPEHNYQLSSALRLTIIPEIDSLAVRVSHAANIQQAEASRIVFSKLVSIYQALLPGIVEEYKKVIPTFTAVVKTKKKAKENLKTGKRALALRAADPGMFAKIYSSSCQKERQPFILDGATDADAISKHFDNPHKVMPFKGRIFACEPREEDDKGKQDQIWPGLQDTKPDPKKTKKAPSKEEIAAANKYAADFPEVPCCFGKDQYIAKKSTLRKFLSEDPGAADEEGDKGKTGGTSMGHIITYSSKMVPEGRFGNVPFNWTKIFGMLGVEKVTKGNQSFYPYLRFGVMKSPDSFLHCMEAAFEKTYSRMSRDEKTSSVLKVRAAMANGDLEVGRQELYDMKVDEIKKVMLDQAYYIAPETFVSIAQAYYKCNIMIYVVDPDHPDGDIVLPRNSQAYLPRDIDHTKPMVLIVKYLSGLVQYPYQCEVIVQASISEDKYKGYVGPFPPSSPVAEMAIGLFYKANEVFIVSPDGYELYNPVQESVV